MLAPDPAGGQRGGAAVLPHQWPPQLWAGRRRPPRMAPPEAIVLLAKLSGGAVAGFAGGWLADYLPIYAEREMSFISQLAVAP